MCGIIGGWLFSDIAQEVIEESLQTIRHRGPDQGGAYQHPPIFLGIRRLSILDLSSGQQPMFNEDGAVVVVFNGEIYNERELTSCLRSQGHTFRSVSDTEVLVHLYEQEETGLCQSLRGMFAFAIWDARQRVLLLARDRFGKKPLYYTWLAQGGILFASELKALRVLAQALGQKWAIRAQGIYDYLSLSVVPQPATIYEGVFALPPASWLRFDGQTSTMQTYWQLQYLPKSTISYRQAVATTRELVAQAVAVRLRSDVPLGVFLSGGVDSSVMAYEAARQIGPQLQTFTIAVDDPTLDESPLARQTAQLLGVANRVLPLRLRPLEELPRLVRQYDQPYADSSAIPSLAISRLARQYVTVVLNGDGGDEIFAGYRRHLAAHWRHWVRGLAILPPGIAARMAGSWQRRSTAGFVSRFLRGLATPAAERYLIWTMDMLRQSDKAKAWRGPQMRPTEEWLETVLAAHLDGLDDQLYSDIRVNLLSDLLVKMDMATMAASLEGRSPLLDHPLAEFVAHLPAGYRLRRGRTKALLRDAYHDALPHEVLWGPKRGFEVPLVAWLTHEWRELLHDTVASPSARIRSYLDDSFIDNVLARHDLQERNWGYIIYSWLVLELWLREFG